MNCVVGCWTYLCLLLCCSSALFRGIDAQQVADSNTVNSGERAKAIIVTGAESTDSTYVTRLIAHVMGVGRGLHGGFAGNVGSVRAKCWVFVNCRDSFFSDLILDNMPIMTHGWMFAHYFPCPAW